MIVLACETSTLLGSVAVVKDQVVVAYKESLRQGSHSDVLNIFVESVLSEAKIKLADIDLFASGIGPGSFTGIRISLNTIKSFSFCLQKPCVGIDSLVNLASQCAEQELLDKPIVAMINAYKNMVYVATYRKEKDNLVVVKNPAVVRVQHLDAYLESESYLIGDGYTAYKNFLDLNIKVNIIRPSIVCDEPNAKTLATLAAATDPQKRSSWSQLIPIYLRESEAEENAKGIKYEPLF